MNHNTNKIIRTVCTVLLIAPILMGVGCASIVQSGTRTITVSSQPLGAEVTIMKADTGEVVHGGTTPMTVSLSPSRGFFSGQSYNLKLEMSGYTTTEIAIRPELSGWYFGNILFGGLIGMLIVDPATGAMWNLTPEKIDRQLKPDQAYMLKNGNGFLVVLLSDTTHSERDNMVSIN